MASANVVEFTADNWNEHVTSGKLVIADFWAPWCGPCRQLAPLIDRIADQFAGKVTVGKLNVDENQSVAVKYDVNTIPRIIFFKGGGHADPSGNRRPLGSRFGSLGESVRSVIEPWGQVSNLPLDFGVWRAGGVSPLFHMSHSKLRNRGLTPPARL